MTNVVPFGRAVVEKSLAGEARCTSCKHQWAAVAPLGVDWLECPACGLMKGRYMHPCVPNEGIWTCACGCDVFHVTAAAVHCIGCGSVQEFGK